MILWTKEDAISMVKKYANRDANTRETFVDISKIKSLWQIERNDIFTYNWINFDIQAGVRYCSEPQSIFGPYYKVQMSIWATDSDRIHIDVQDIDQYLFEQLKEKEVYIFHYLPVDELISWIYNMPYNGTPRQEHRSKSESKKFRESISKNFI